MARIGSIGYATSSGLGHLARDFHRHGIITDFVVVRHPSFHTHEDWFPGAAQTAIRPLDRRMLRQFCDHIDVLFAIETPFCYDLFDYCRQRGKRTVLLTMYECSHMPQLQAHPPDLFLCPSLLDLQYFPAERSKFLPVPVDVPWRQRTKAEVFVHNGGHGGLRGRNGSREVLEAWLHVRSPARLIFRSQASMFGVPEVLTDPRVTVELGTAPYEELWATGDVCLFPERFNGLSLPLQEARAAGMLVMGTDRFPMNQWLPREPLIPVSGFRQARIGPPYPLFDEAIVDPRAIAAKVDEYFGRDISEYSLSAREWAETMSWANLAPKYREALAG